MLFSVFTTGRTGSMLLCRNISKYFNIPIYEDNIDSELTIKTGVIHTHNPLWIPSGVKCTAIISKRRNLFDSIISSFVANHTKETVKYSQKTFEPFYIDPLKFEYRYVYEQTFYKIINYSKFDQVIEIFYEDMISNKKYLFSTLGIDHDTNMTLTLKSPHNNVAAISNIDELKLLFDKLICRPITDIEIIRTKNNVEQDIVNAKKYFTK